MYIEKLKTWTNNDWWELFDIYGIWVEKWKEVRALLTSPSKEEIESNWRLLEGINMVNWVWPSSLMSITRKIISFLFRGVKYRWHDVSYALGGTERDRWKADWGLLKYSTLSIIYWLLVAYASNSPIVLPLFLLAAIIQFAIALFCYLAVAIFGVFAFRYTY